MAATEGAGAIGAAALSAGEASTPTETARIHPSTSASGNGLLMISIELKMPVLNSTGYFSGPMSTASSPEIPDEHPQRRAGGRTPPPEREADPGDGARRQASRRARGPEVALPARAARIDP